MIDQRARLGPLLFVGTVVACLVAVGLVALTGTDYAAVGLRGPDGFTRNGLIVVRILAEVGGVLCVGSLLFAAFMVPAQESGVLSADGYRALRAAGWAAALWCVSAILSVPFTVADSFTQPLGSMDFGKIVDLAASLEQTKAWLLTAGVAVVLVVATSRVLLRRSTTVLLGVAVFGLVPVAASGHSSSGGDHDWATASLLWHLVAAALWVGGLVALLAYGRRKGEHLAWAANRFSRVALVCWIVMAASGVINALVRLKIQNLFATSYGLLTLGKIAALVVLGVFGYLQRERGLKALHNGSGRALVRLAAFEVLVMMITIGLATALGRTPPPDHGAGNPSTVELRIGYGLDGPPTLARTFADWRFDLILGTIALAMAVLYLVGVRRLKARGGDWPVSRTIAWLGGCAEVVLATSSGIGRYGPAVFSVDMVSNMLLSILAPILLVLGAPLTLAGHTRVSAHAEVSAHPEGEGGRRSPGSTLPLGTDNSGPAGSAPVAASGMAPLVGQSRMVRLPRFLTHPAAVVALFVGSFFVLYFSGLFEWSLDVPLAHVGMNAYFLLTGCLFFWAVIGADPFPRPIPLKWRRAMVFTAIPGHALFGAALLTSQTVIGDHFYRTLGLWWNSNLLDIQRLGGGVAWGAGVVPLLIVAMALFGQSRADLGHSDADGVPDDGGGVVVVRGGVAVDDHQSSPGGDGHGAQ
ncbi:putative copper resistance protein D [Actinocrispum wychmicini]|uniref:Putative copper resistance protein D n=1 Tax=Actinocrispum wychmicini TaxID=1213861 RepID=A0A4R2IVP3_9PSEU|nr:putative copper resistance protein D [Actinocrispum wychmicini]